MCVIMSAGSGGEEKLTLHGLRLQVPKGQLLGICGEVGLATPPCCPLRTLMLSPPLLGFPLL